MRYAMQLRSLSAPWKTGHAAFLVEGFELVLLFMMFVLDEQAARPAQMHRLQLTEGERSGAVRDEHAHRALRDALCHRIGHFPVVLRQAVVRLCSVRAATLAC